MTIGSIGWKSFHRLFNLAAPAAKNRENANIALAAGKAQGLPVYSDKNSGWDYGNDKNFMVKHPKP